MFINYKGAQFFAVEYGSGPRTLLAQGGWTGSWELWCQPFTDLSKTWRAVAYDHRGTGATLAPPDSITFDTLVEDVFVILDALDIASCVLAGESAGAAVVLKAAALHPERIEGLVLVDGLYSRPPAPEPDIYAHRLETDYEAAMGDFADLCVLESEPNSAAIRRWGRHILTRSGMPWTARLRACMFGVDVRPIAPQITQPTLIIHGDSDAIVPLESSKWLATQIPHSRLHIIHGAGHVPTMTYPREVAAAINDFFG